MSEAGDLGAQMLCSVESLECTMEELPDEEVLDPDFRAFLQDHFVSPGPKTPKLSHCLPSTLLNPSPGLQFGLQGRSSFPGSSLQQFGLLQSPGTTERKRKHQFEDPGEMSQSLPARLMHDYTGEVSTPFAQPASWGFGPIRASTVKSTVLNASRQAISPGSACAMPFCLVKKYPSSDSLSLDDINSRIQKLAQSSDTTRTPTNSDTSNSTRLKQPSPPKPSKRGSRKRAASSR